MKSNPTFSVVVPTIGNQNLYDTIHSVLAQEYKDYEVLIVMDGDLESQVIGQLGNLASHDKIKIIRNFRSAGGNGARNSGILKSGGKYICFLDDDDEWYPKRLERAAHILHNSGENMGGCLSGYRYWTGSTVSEKPQIESRNMLSDLLLGKLHFGNSSNFIFKKETINAIGLWDERLKRHQDFEYLARLLNNYMLLTINEVLLKINGHSTQPAAKTMIDSKIRFLFKVRHSVNKLDENQRKYFFEKEFNELLNIASSDGNLRLSICLMREMKARNLNVGNSKSTLTKIALFPVFKIRSYLFRNHKIKILYKSSYKNRYRKIPS